MAAIPNSNIREKVNGQWTDRVTIAEGANSFAPPKNCDAITVEYPNNTTEIYRYRQGGLAGTILKSVQAIYTTSSKNEIQSIEIL